MRLKFSSYHLADVTSDVVLDSELPETSSSMERGRFLATPFGQAPTTLLALLTCWKASTLV